MLPGRPTVRKAEILSGEWMTREANAGTSKGDRKPGPMMPVPSLAVADNWPDRGVCLDLKGC